MYGGMIYKMCHKFLFISVCGTKKWAFVENITFIVLEAVPRYTEATVSFQLKFCHYFYIYSIYNWWEFDWENDQWECSSWYRLVISYPSQSLSMFYVCYWNTLSVYRVCYNLLDLLYVNFTNVLCYLSIFHREMILCKDKST